MSKDAFRATFETLALDASHPETKTIRLEPLAQSTTVVFDQLPAISVGTQTSPEIALGETIGEGGMGVVRQGTQMSLQREVAVKTLHPDRRNPAAQAGLLHEALVTGSLEHPGVVPIYALGRDDSDAPVIVMKRIEGVPWDVCLQDPQRAPASALDADDLLGSNLDVFVRVCQAVHFAHARGILHRDIKPENVMLGAFGEVYLVDWGVAVTMDPTRSGALQHIDDVRGVSGTPAYMAPEMTTGRGTDLSERTDVYLLGATLAHVLRSAPPHTGNSLFEIMFRAHESEPLDFDGYGVDDELVAIVHQAMAKDPRDRYDSAESLRRAVLEFERHRNSAALATSAADRMGALQSAIDDEDSSHTQILGIAGECRFGFEQAIREWPENSLATTGRQNLLRLLLQWEVKNEDLRAAQSSLAAIENPTDDERQAVANLRATLRAREQDIERLREHHRESDVTAAASFRARAGMAATAFFTLIPLLSDLNIRFGTARATPAGYITHGYMVVFFLGIVIWVWRRQLLHNRANRRIILFVAVYTMWTPAFRYVAMLQQLAVEAALAIEVLSYGIVYAGVALLSNGYPLFGFAIYIAAGILSAQFPEYIYRIMAAANLIAVGTQSWAWATQSPDEVGSSD